MLKNNKGQLKIDNPDKRATLGTQDTRRRQTKQKHNAICVGHHYTQANTNNGQHHHHFIQRFRVSP